MLCFAHCDEPFCDAAMPDLEQNTTLECVLPERKFKALQTVSSRNRQQWALITIQNWDRAKLDLSLVLPRFMLWAALPTSAHKTTTPNQTPPFPKQQQQQKATGPAAARTEDGNKKTEKKDAKIQKQSVKRQNKSFNT